MKALATIWTQGIRDQKAKQDFEAAVRNSKIALGRLLEITEGRVADLEITREADFNNPSWANREAWRLGQKKALSDLIELLSFIKGTE